MIKIIQLSNKLLIILISVLLLQSCQVYKSTPVTTTEATEKNREVKIKTKNGEILKFDRLQMNDGQLFGITKKNSKTAKLLDQYIIKNSTDSKFVKILLDQKTIEEIKIKNKGMSKAINIGGFTLISIVAGVVVVALFLVGV